MKISRTRVLAATLAAVFAVLGAGGAIAAEGGPSTPYLKVVIPIEIENDWNYRSDAPAGKLNDLFATIEPEATLGLFGGLSLFAHAVIEPMRPNSPAKSRYFESHGVLIEDLYLQFEGDLTKGGSNQIGFRVWGGKFTPKFGIAWDAAPGIYGVDFAEDYELTERLGFGAELAHVHGWLGKHTLSASTFFLDTSALSGSIITRRRVNRLDDGGPSNTDRLSSLQIALDGEDAYGVEGLQYHLAFVHQRVRGPGNEQGLAAAVTYGIAADGYTITPLIEVVRFWDADGVAGQKRFYLTTSVEVERQGWTFSLSHTWRNTRLPAGAGTGHDTLFTTSGGYAFDNGVGVAIGWSHRNEDSISTDTLGLLLSYELSFEVGGK